MRKISTQEKCSNHCKPNYSISNNVSRKIGSITSRCGCCEERRGAISGARPLVPAPFYRTVAPLLGDAVSRACCLADPQLRSCVFAIPKPRSLANKQKIFVGMKERGDESEEMKERGEKKNRSPPFLKTFETLEASLSFLLHVLLCPLQAFLEGSLFRHYMIRIGME